MRTRSTLGTAVLLATTLALGAACSGRDDGTDGAGPGGGGTGATSAAPVTEGAVPDSGWWCRLIEQEVVDAATGGRSAEAREVLRRNDAGGYRCDVVLPEGTGPHTETVLALEVTVGDDEAVAAARAEGRQATDVTAGPDYLGESYLWPGRAVAIVPCRSVGGAAAGEPVPHLFTLTASHDAGAALVQELVDPVRRSIVEVDQATGCSPSAATGSADGSAATTGP